MPCHYLIHPSPRQAVPTMLYLLCMHLFFLMIEDINAALDLAQSVAFLNTAIRRGVL
jgi:hypothetical protein